MPSNTKHPGLGIGLGIALGSVRCDRRKYWRVARGGSRNRHGNRSRVATQGARLPALRGRSLSHAGAQRRLS